MDSPALFSNHGHVLLCLADDPEARLRDVAARIDITERAVQKIVRDLQLGGLISVSKQGRRNRYRINTRKTLQLPLDVQRTVGQLIALMRESGRDREPEQDRSEPEPAPPPVVDLAPEPVPPAKRDSPVSTSGGAKAEDGPAENARPAKPELADEQPGPPARKKGKAPPPGDQQGSLF